MKWAELPTFLLYSFCFPIWHPMQGLKMPKTSVMDIDKLIEPIVEDQGMELVDVQFRQEQGGWVLRLFIDQPGGITLEDCADISGRVGAVLEVKDVLDVPYVLEVSSPGVNRPLRKKRDFQRFSGHRIVLQTIQSIGGQKNFKGQLMGFQEDKLLLLCAAGQEVKISLDNIAQAHVDYLWDDTPSGGRRVRSKGSRRYDK